MSGKVIRFPSRGRGGGGDALFPEQGGDQTDNVARQLLYIARSLCFDDHDQANDALRRAVAIIDAGEDGRL